MDRYVLPICVLLVGSSRFDGTYSSLGDGSNTPCPSYRHVVLVSCYIYRAESLLVLTRYTGVDRPTILPQSIPREISIERPCVYARFPLDSPCVQRVAFFLGEVSCQTVQYERRCVPYRVKSGLEAPPWLLSTRGKNLDFNFIKLKPFHTF